MKFLVMSQKYKSHVEKKKNQQNANRAKNNTPKIVSNKQLMKITKKPFKRTR